jgi:prolyl-tRNA editing enzyme YbaK/EbsC (Cys-tRNA(Pro) deacylase)
MQLGRLAAVPALDRADLLAAPVAQALTVLSAVLKPDDVGVAEIDPELADTAAFCEHYGVALAESANCVVVAGKRDGQARYAACVVLATTRADVNGIVRRQLDVRKASFAPMDAAVEQTGMEYGGITPIGLPGWPVLIDSRVAAHDGYVVIGSGIRASKLAIPAHRTAELMQAEVINQLAN